MKLIIDPKVFEQNHDLKIGAILIRGTNIERRVSPVESLLRGVCAQRIKEFADKDVFENPMVQAWCQAYGKFGINPRKYPPSIAALLKKIANGKEIPHINVLVDLYNYFSLKHLLPIGGEDLDWICGDLRLTYTKGGEPFRPIGSIEVEQAGEGEIAYMDDGGITCRFWNYRECERSKFTTKTVNAVILIEDLSKMHMDEFGVILREIQNTIIKYIGGQIETYILNEENNTIDLGIQGRKNADDSKIPQQEIADFIERKKEKTEKKVSAVDSPAKKKLQTSSSFLEMILQGDDDLFRNKIRKIITTAVKKTFPKEKGVEISIEYPANESHGDYACNIAMHLAKKMAENPRAVAEKILTKIPANKILGKVEIAGPGFINFTLSEKSLTENLKKILTAKGQFGTQKIGKGETMIFEYSSPNIAKPLGIHHLMTTIIGQALRNIYEKLGFNCLSINHIGDWGTQFGKLIYAYRKWGSREVVEKNPIDELLKLYVKFHDEAEKNPKLEDEGRLEFKKFEDGDSENRKLWKWFVEVSMKEINQTYDLLGGVNFDHIMGESFYEDKMAAILEDGKEKGVFSVGEEGALVIKFEDENIPTVPIQKKDGATLYITRDFATLKYRIEKWHPLKIVYVVGSDQSTHFKQLFAGAEKLGWYHGEAEHVGFGRMQFKEGKMSTRKGKIILLNDVLNEAVKVTEELIKAKNSELKDIEKVARVVGIGAVKYNILSQNRSTDITFDWDKMLSLDSNSAPYLQYSYARAKSILRKADENFAEHGEEFKEENAADVKMKTENLMRYLVKFPECLLPAAVDYKPNIVCNYLYQLAQKFNGFYNSVPVLKVADERVKAERLRIVEAFAQVMKNGLELLGLEVIEAM